jgi:site-specific recombinase XerD
VLTFPPESSESEVGGATTLRLNTAASMYLRYLTPHVTHETLSVRRYRLEAFVEYMGGNTAIKAIKTRHLQAWIDDMTCRPSTIKQRFFTIRQMFTYALHKRWVTALPTFEVKLPRETRRKPRALTYEQMTAIGNVLPDARARVIIALAVNEGLRRVEIANLQLGDIDFVDRIITVVTAKSKTTDELPLSDDTHGRLLTYLAERGRKAGALILSYQSGRGLTPQTIGRLAAQWMREAGVKGSAFDGVSLHACRHTLAVTMLDRDADPTVIQRGLRHSNLQSTWTYLRVMRSVEELRKYMGGPRMAS